MKNKLYRAVVICALLSLIALPVFAQDAIPMWISRARLAYVGRSSSGPDAVVGKIHVRDANNTMVEDALVTAEWTLPDGSTRQVSAMSAFQGIAEFRVWSGRGVYKLCVLDVTKEGWLYDPSLSLENCPVFIVP